MIQFRQLRLARAAKVLVDAATSQIHPGWKVARTGANGSGKSSRFAVQRGQPGPDRGDRELPAGSLIAHVAHETPALQRSALEYVLDGDRELRRIEADLTVVIDAVKHGWLEAHEAIEGLDAEV